MAIISTVADDFDGSTPAETVSFSVSGRDYEIDLSEQNRAELDALLAEFEDKMKKFTDAARPAGRTTSARSSSGGRASSKSSSTSSAEASKVRLWAVDNGFDVKDRGRIPAEVMDAYRNRGKKG